MLLSPDFFSYFAATAPVLDADPSLLCVSSWNDHGQVCVCVWDGGGGGVLRVEGEGCAGGPRPRPPRRHAGIGPALANTRSASDASWASYLREPVSHHTHPHLHNCRIALCPTPASSTAQTSSLGWAGCCRGACGRARAKRARAAWPPPGPPAIGTTSCASMPHAAAGSAYGAGVQTGALSCPALLSWCLLPCCLLTVVYRCCTRTCTQAGGVPHLQLWRHRQQQRAVLPPLPQAYQAQRGCGRGGGGVWELKGHVPIGTNGGGLGGP